ncbi:MAG: desulfoferrodoxin FeS4 iron-binding domain-containing protein [Gracilibacteraceae bacterium]|jgi:superoxide reductase|nr:desulfoferrodoxin FeS4 iron-binding domain-containing protein [Gracilibacteraceae bacterium]
MSEQFFFKCTHCGNIVGLIKDGGVRLVCCGEPLTELQANTTDAAQEKHVPVAARTGDVINVTVGEVAHPMLEEHSIEWIYVKTKKGGQRKTLRPGEKPAAAFALTDDEAIAVYAYCNLHGLWKVSL